MKAILTILLLCAQVFPSFSTDHSKSSAAKNANIAQQSASGLSPAGQAKFEAAQKLARDLNQKIFDNRHGNLGDQVQSINRDARKKWNNEIDPNPGHFDTVAVRVDSNGEVYVAANTKTRDIPERFKNPETGAKLPKSPKQGNKPNQGKKPPFNFETKNYGLDTNDMKIIVDTVRKNPTFKDSRIHIIETQQRPTSRAENAAPHAEMKLVKDRGNIDTSNSRSSSIIVASKPTCELCSNQLTKQNIPHNSENGLTKDKIRNWQAPEEIGKLNKVTFEPGESASIPKDTDISKPTSVPGTCSKRSPGGRRKRAVGSGCGSGCAICLGSNGQVESVNQKEFVEKYNSADENGKRQMADLVKRDTSKVESDGNSNKVKKLVQLENAKSHANNVGLVDSVQRVGKKIKPIGKDLGKKGWNYLKNVGEKLSKVPTKVKLRISGTKIAQGLSRLAARKGMQKFSSKMGKVSSKVGKFLMAKTIVNGIMQGDTTSLAIVGGRLGGEALIKGAVWAGKKFFKQGSKVFKAAKFLGKAAGPIGMAVDVGFSVWSLTKSVERLNNATNVYDRNDAIADVVADSISLVVSITVIAFAPVFPPIIAIGFIVEILTSIVVALFKAGNEVARVDSEVPLLDHEKSTLYFEHLFNWFGTRKPNYLDHLVGEKKANDLAVQHNLNFLEENSNFAGIVFPSRTLVYEGSCTFYKQTCAFRFIWIWCTSWNAKEWMGSGCDKNGECASCHHSGCKCYDENGKRTKLECRCNGPSSGNTIFGDPRRDSLVDLRTKQSVYLERSVPKDVQNADFLCKPGSTSYAGFTKSQEYTTYSYLCKNAIGLLRPYRQGNQTLLFNLEDGDDTVYVDPWESRPNLFLMGRDGHKKFYGSNGNDNFAFTSECNGTLRGEVNGNTGSDTITLGETCAKGKEIKMDFKRGRLTSPNANNLNMNFVGIEAVIGRKGEREVVEVSCSARTVVGQGGTYNQMDYVNIPNDHCSYNITVFVASYTKVVSMAKYGSLVFPIGKEWNGAELKLDLYENLQLQMVFTETSSREINGGSLNVKADTMNLRIKKGSEEIWFSFQMKHGKNDVSIYFTENPKGSPSSVLYLTNESNEPVFYHSLSNFDGMKERTGSPFWKNIFELTGSGWKVTGGNKDDDFVLNTEQVEMLNGGDGVDTLKFSEKFREHVTIDLQSSRFKNIEKVIGNPSISLTVITACETEMVAGQGGTSYQPDLIRVGNAHCRERNLQIIATAYSKVVLDAGPTVPDGKDKINILAHPNSQGVTDFSLETKLAEVEHLSVAILINHRNWLVASTVVDTSQQSILVMLEESTGSSSKGKINLKLKQNINSETTEPYFQLPLIQVSIEDSTDLPAYMVFDRKSANPKLIFQPADNSQYAKEMIANGFQGIENLFVFKTSSVKWTATGGNKNDQFVLRLTSKDGGQYSIDGGNSGENVLFIEGEPEVKQLPFLVNLANKELGFLATSSDLRGSVINIQHVVGRPNAPDIIHPTCDTKTVNGNGGAGIEDRFKDVINIRYGKCPMALLLTVGRYTDVNNRAVKGDFTYIVSDLATSSLDLKPTKTLNHFIQFRFHPWEQISAVALDSSGSIMAWNVSNGQIERTHIFKMALPSQTGEYGSPKFDFRVPESSISSDIRVGTNKVTLATFNIHGMNKPENVHGIPVDVNRFLINITNPSSTIQPVGEIHGCSNGQQCSANQFWIFDLATPLQILDGGECAIEGCKNYLHFASGINSMSNSSRWIVDMNIADGYVETEEGVTVIETLKNIHELHGTQNIVVYASCNTTKISGVSEVVITGTCPELNLAIGIENYTQVVFLNDELVYMEEEEDEQVKGSVHYKFSEPLSFMPEGDYFAMTAYNHYYYLPFSLDALNGLYFSLEDETLFYILNETVYNFPMASFIKPTDQFYSQPSIITQDGYRLQISREGAVWATLGNNETAEMIDSEQLPELREMADRLGITMMIKGPTEFFFIGHSSDSGMVDRNVLHNIANYKSYLAGGGVDNTIYEIVSLDTDTLIYTGYTEETFQNWTDTRKELELKQTIDLTDVVVPIRFATGTKYVPSVSTDDDNNLVITMDGFEKENPGRVVIVRGAYEWVAVRMQLLLSSAIMDLVPAAIAGRRRKRSTGTQEITDWKIRPRTIIIPKDVSVFSLAPEELEDGQDIQLESLTSNQTSNEANSTQKFDMIRNGTDLYLTNVKSAEDEEVTTILIPDIFEPSPYLGMKDGNLAVRFENTDPTSEESDDEKEMDNFVLPAKLTGININLPGVTLLINDTQIFNTTNDNNSSSLTPVDVLTLTDWEDALYDLEETVLEEMPEVQKTFPSEQERKPVQRNNLTCTNSRFLMF